MGWRKHFLHILSCRCNSCWFRADKKFSSTLHPLLSSSIISSNLFFLCLLIKLKKRALRQEFVKRDYSVHGKFCNKHRESSFSRKFGRLCRRQTGSCRGSGSNGEWSLWTVLSLACPLIAFPLLTVKAQDLFDTFESHSFISAAMCLTLLKTSCLTRSLFVNTVTNDCFCN